jgi:hypothetical protein
MKHETTLYVSECDTYWKVKADYMKPKGLLAKFGEFWSRGSTCFVFYKFGLV